MLKEEKSIKYIIMIRKAILDIRNTLKTINKINDVNKNLNFLINQTLSMDSIKTMPSVKHIQMQQIQILEKLNGFFKSNNIEYFLIYGSLLGAVRHQGFVPWDDDIDLALFQEDFNKLLVHEDQLNKLGLHFSSPDSPKGNYNGLGWHKVYDHQMKYHVSLFNFDLINTDNIHKQLHIRTKYNAAARNYRTRFQKGKIPVRKLKTKLDDLNARYFSEGIFKTKASANADTFIVKNICNHQDANYSSFRHVFPLKEVDFIVHSDQSVQKFPIPNNPEAILEDFYGKDFLHFPKNLFPIH